ncbi:MAG: IclR family transcriptional regulator [Thermoleophilia bacterium]|nr:IclR family transcriptional regulator [Thermoleophilia bacterium]
MPKQKENMVGTVVKAAAIIDAVAKRGSASATGIAEDLGEPRSSVYRILKSLKELGYVDPGSSCGSFRLGLKLVRLGGQSRARLNIRDVSLPVMERIHDDTGETVYLCLRAGNEAMCIERLDGHRVTSLALQVGGTLPLHVGAGPRALLAFSPRKFWHQYAAEVRLKEPDGRSHAKARRTELASGFVSRPCLEGYEYPSNIQGSPLNRIPDPLRLSGGRSDTGTVGSLSLEY